jgi:imidazolonepropionase-like amidohydrolase
MFGFPFHLQLRENIRKGEMLGPTIYTSSPVLEGPEPSWPQSVRLKNITEARAAVIRFKNAGFDFIKIYHTLTPELYNQILQVSDSINIPVTGHIPLKVALNNTLSSTQYSMEHINLWQLRKISPTISLETKAAMIGKAQKWICPTLLVHKNTQKHPEDFSPQKHYEQYVDNQTKKFWKQRLKEGESEYELQKKLANIMFDTGARFLAGTDCLNPYILPGFSLHEELEELVSVGLSEFEALKTGTVNAAEFLKRSNDMGTVETGKMADLLLLEANPLENISNTRKISGVMIKGRWLSAEELDTMLKDVKSDYADN